MGVFKKMRTNLLLFFDIRKKKVLFLYLSKKFELFRGHRPGFAGPPRNYSRTLVLINKLLAHKT